MKCYAIRPEDKEGDFIMIKNELEDLQKFVGGYIEVVPTYFTNVVVICDEEGRLKGKPYCCFISGLEFVGPVLLAGVNNGEFTDVPFTDADLIRNILGVK